MIDDWDYTEDDREAFWQEWKEMEFEALKDMGVRHGLEDKNGVVSRQQAVQGSTSSGCSGIPLLERDARERLGVSVEAAHRDLE